MENYSIKAFVADVLTITSKTSDENEIVSQVAPLAQLAAADASWRNEDMYIADSELGFSSTLLHSEADNSLFVVVDSWLPGRGVRPHDHGTWAVVVGVTGPEHNVYWERVDDRSQENHAELIKLKEEVISIGEVACMKTGEIHSIENRTGETTLSFHVYGRHLNFTGRSQFDVENNLEVPLIIETR
jgi:predicted metal-dependent enzyme (double-stranded beta helix superfamily)